LSTDFLKGYNYSLVGVEVHSMFFKEISKYVRTQNGGFAGTGHQKALGRKCWYIRGSDGAANLTKKFCVIFWKS
jgi:hypothetical protein